MFRFLSLGAGRQSSYLLLKYARGELPRIDAAGFADTKAEPKKVYSWLEWLEEEVARSPYPFPIYRGAATTELAKEALRVRVSRKTGNVYVRTLLPAFVAKPNGERALMGRRCTTEYKLRVLMAMQRRLLKRQGVSSATFRQYTKPEPGNPIPSNPAPLMQVIQGISAEEAIRMKSPLLPWQSNQYPLVEQGITADQCVQWIFDTYGRYPPESSCKFCPFHSDAHWLAMREEHPDEFAEAVAFDYALREAASKQTGTAALAGPVYLHSSLKPLDRVEFKDVPSHVQVNQFNNDCTGLCGV